MEYLYIKSPFVVRDINPLVWPLNVLSGWLKIANEPSIRVW